MEWSQLFICLEWEWKTIKKVDGMETRKLKFKEFPIAPFNEWFWFVSIPITPKQIIHFIPKLFLIFEYQLRALIWVKSLYNDNNLNIEVL